MSRSSQVPSPFPGHDILARYLNAYVHARQLSDIERPWGLGDDALDSLWIRLTQALASDPNRLDRLISEELNEKDREHIVATLAPLIFALPLREYPAELRAIRSGPRLMLSIRHLGLSDTAPKVEKPLTDLAKKHKLPDEEPIGFLPAALTASFVLYLRHILKFSKDQQRRDATVSSGGRRRHVRVTLLAGERGILIRFLERLPSPADEGR